MTYDEMIEIIEALKNGEVIQEKCGEDGRWEDFDPKDDSLQLSLVNSFPYYAYRVKPKTKRVYVNVHETSSGGKYMIEYDTREAAMIAAKHSDRCIAGFRQEYTEGQFDD